MARISPDDIPLPGFLEPLLQIVSDNVPAPVYSIFLSVLSHSLAVITAFSSLMLSLLSTHPLQWNAQTVLPPLIALLSAYVALVSLYRTTALFLRTGFWILKWGTLFGLLIAALSWVMASTSRNTEIGTFSVVSGVTGMVMDLINGQGQNAAGGSRVRRSTARTEHRRRKPKAWDSFAQHKEWQYREEQAVEHGTAQKMLADMLSSAENLLTGGKWWEVAKGAMSGAANPDSNTIVQEGGKSRGSRSR
jgi:hypothetical protein